MGNVGPKGGMVGKGEEVSKGREGGEHLLKLPLMRHPMPRKREWRREALPDSTLIRFACEVWKTRASLVHNNL